MPEQPPADAPDRKRLLPFLQDPGSYPHAPERVRLVQTHASYVALVPPYVYKVKKAVDFGFLDFSMLEKRRHYCEVEVALNSRLCPDLYEGVVPITRQNGHLTFGGDGEAVEYAVKMKELPDGRFLNQLLAQGTATEAHLDRVAETLAAFYGAETPSPETAAWGRIDRLRISTDENFEQTEAHVGTLLAFPTYEALRYYTDRFYDHHARLLNRRRAEGHILDCHGDLHTEHVHLTPERVCIYDCIEFNERFRSIDVANDLAFLAMDLDFNERPDLAHHFVRRMTKALNDADLLLLIDFYKCYRAYVRGKVEGLRSAEEEIPRDERQQSRERARRYYQLALRYAVAGSAPLVIVIMGNVGTGKSTQADALARALGWPAPSSDRTRKELFGIAPYERGSTAVREQLYTRALSRKTYAALCEHATARAARGQGTVLDATYGHRAYRDALRDALAREGSAHCFVELAAGDEELRKRLEERATQERVVSDARLEDFDMLSTRYDAPDALEDPFHFTVDTTGATTETTTLCILKQIIRLDFGKPSLLGRRDVS